MTFGVQDHIGLVLYLDLGCLIRSLGISRLEAGLLRRVAIQNTTMTLREFPGLQHLNYVKQVFERLVSESPMRLVANILPSKCFHLDRY